MTEDAGTPLSPEAALEIHDPLSATFPHRNRTETQLDSVRKFTVCEGELRSLAHLLEVGSDRILEHAQIEFRH